MEQGQKAKQKWEHLTTLTDGAVSLRIDKLPFKMPGYSITLETLSKEGKPHNHISVKLIRENGRVELESNLSQRIEALVRNAEDYILDDAQRAEDAFRRKGEALARQSRAPKKGNYRDPGGP